jgi:hypothetical protein
MNYNIDNLFSLSISQKITATKITMIMYSNQLNTSNLPDTYTRLQKLLPSVLVTECYNDENLPFAIEVRNTEIGHLFEHILIEYLCQLKIAKGHNSAVFSGRTRWNWVKDPRGMFHIYLDCGQKDADLLPIALQKTIKLMKIILKENNASFFNLNLQRFSFLNNGLKNGKKYFLRNRHKKS